MKVSARDVARVVLRRVWETDAFASRVLDAELERAAMDPRDRGLATELVYGVLRHRTRLDRALAAMTARGSLEVKPVVRAALRVAAYQLLMLDRVPAHAAIDDAVGAVKRKAGPRVGGFVNAVLRRLARDGEPALPPVTEARRHVELALSTPAWIADAIARARGDGALVEVAGALNTNARLAIRINAQVGDAAAVARRLAGEGARVEPIPYLPGGLWLANDRGSPTRYESFTQGWWTVQDAGAQLVAHAAAPPPGSRVLDACAGLGGKTLHLAELVRRGGATTGPHAVDVSGKKLEWMERAAARMGIADVRHDIVDLTDAEACARVLDDAYDVVVVDAPCSGLGVLRRHPELKWRASADKVTELAALQATLLETLAQRVAVGGALVYCVCTFTEAEGPLQVEQFLARHGAFVLAPPPPSDGVVWNGLVAADGSVRTWPDRHDADAFYIARLERRGP